MCPPVPCGCRYASGQQPRPAGIGFGMSNRMLESPALGLLLAVVVLTSVLGPCVGLAIWAIEHRRKHGGLESIGGLVLGLLLWGIATAIWLMLSVPCLMHCGNRRTSWTEIMATPVYVLLAIAITWWTVTRGPSMREEPDQ